MSAITALEAQWSSDGFDDATGNTTDRQAPRA